MSERLATAASIGPVVSSATPAREREHVDVVVLGAGGAGMRAAYEAASAGLSVVVLEKARTFGGTSIKSGGVIQAAGTAAQVARGIDDSPERFRDMLILAGEGWVDEELVSDMCAHSAEHVAFLERMGVTFDGVFAMAHLPYGDPGLVVPRVHETPTGAWGIYSALHRAAMGVGARFVYSCEATSLLKGPDGAVRGVRAARSGHDGRREEEICARRGVIVATGGVDQSEPMLRRLNHQQHWDLEHYESFTAATNTGDGVRMGIEAGAMPCNFGGAIDLTGRLLAGINARSPMMAAVFVDARGRRFVCEDCTYSYVAREVYRQTMATGHPCLTVFGASSLPYGPFSLAGVEGEVAAGTAWRGETPEELGRAAGIDPRNLAVTIARWNDDVASGDGDTQFGRVTGLARIEPPYYAFVEGVMNLGGLGGLAIDRHARVLDCGGSPIPGLYAAGMASAGWIGPYYPGSGIALLGGLHWGWRAGESVCGPTAQMA